jgi:predicted site-specific integrase-resolvase
LITWGALIEGNPMAQLFYARSSSASQDSGLQLQIDRAKSLGIDARFIFSELKSGKDTKRPALQKPPLHTWPRVTVERTSRSGCKKQRQRKRVEVRYLCKAAFAQTKSDATRPEPANPNS